eukprot:6121959-Heterocapsa_arctica.AAC.1
MRHLAVLLVHCVVIVAGPRPGGPQLPSWAAHSPKGATKARLAGASPVRRHRDGPTIRQPASAIS